MVACEVQTLRHHRNTQLGRVQNYSVITTEIIKFILFHYVFMFLSYKARTLRRRAEYSCVEPVTMTSSLERSTYTVFMCARMLLNVRSRCGRTCQQEFEATSITYLFGLLHRFSYFIQNEYSYHKSEINTDL